MALMLDFLAIGIHQVELEAAELGTFPTVGRTTETILRCIANTRITNAKGTVHEDFEFHIRHSLMDFSDFLDGKFTSQHSSMETQRLKPLHLLGSSRITLGAGMQSLNPLVIRRLRAVAFQGIEHAHILKQQCIDTRIKQVLDHPQGILDFRVIDDGIDGDMNFCLKLMGIVTQLLDILDGVTRSGTSTKLGCPNIYGIRPMVNGSNTTR